MKERSQQEFLAADQAEKKNCKDSQKVSGKMKCLHLAEKLTESQSVEMRSSKFFVGYCGSSLFPCHVVFSRGSMSRAWISSFQRHSSPYRGMEFAGGIQGVEPQLPGMSGALPSAAPVRRELRRDRYGTATRLVRSSSSRCS